MYPQRTLISEVKLHKIKWSIGGWFKFYHTWSFPGPIQRLSETIIVVCCLVSSLTKVNSKLLKGRSWGFFWLKVQDFPVHV